MHQYAWNFAAGFCNQISGIMPNWFWMVHCGWSCIRFSIRTGIIFKIDLKDATLSFFGRIQCAAECWNQCQIGELILKGALRRVDELVTLFLRLVLSCRIDFKVATLFFGSVLESNQWQIGKLILKGAVRKVDEVVTVSGISNYWRLEATPYQPPANSHLTRIISNLT